MPGWLRLYRKSLKSRAFQNEGLWKVWCWCLMRAGYGSAWVPIQTGRGSTEVALGPGQFIFGRKSAASELRMKPTTVWKRMQKLKNMKNIDIQSDTHFSLITVMNWDAYQPGEEKSDSQSDRQGTGKGQARDNQGTQIRIDKNTKKTKEVKKPCAKPGGLRLADGPFYLTKKGKKLAGKRLESFNRFWQAWGPYKLDKAKAADAWLNIPQLTDTLVDTIVAAAEAEAARRPEIKASGLTPQYPEGWLSGRRWEDEITGEADADDWSEAAKFARRRP